MESCTSDSGGMWPSSTRDVFREPWKTMLKAPFFLLFLWELSMKFKFNSVRQAKGHEWRWVDEWTDELVQAQNYTRLWDLLKPELLLHSRQWKQVGTGSTCHGNCPLKSACRETAQCSNISVKKLQLSKPRRFNKQGRLEKALLSIWFSLGRF